MKLNIRPATLSDAAYIFGLANDPQIRANSFHSQAIDWEGYLAWIKQKLQDPCSKIYLISKKTTPQPRHSGSAACPGP